MSEFRSKAINIKVTPDVHEFLVHQAERRGVTMSAMCAWILGEWKASIEDRTNTQRQGSQLAVQAMMEQLGPQLQEMLKGIETEE